MYVSAVMFERVIMGVTLFDIVFNIVKFKRLGILKSLTNTDNSF